MKKSYWIGLVLIIVFVALGAQSFHKSITRYVPVSEAKTSTTDAVQVAGDLKKDTIHYDIRKGELRFEIADKTGALTVLYPGERPGNFEQATRVVVNGTFDLKANGFRAKELLVKCPSKYQGTETTK